ncbi:TIGR04282 family arsenosugar biosynthesis glycosyltransferase [Halomonas sp. SSL-5]|uniref:TIGR04282 family arsenosugar biosynthesis glycosyltransferase n=1 Tax=Halomonas sp. SSL-5 TaxID=3065855 RepID=UPI002739BAF8|nr:TIGR04282 family arsenosugar biosynthesis glycosyltransferase [Halomonas sp. SSL-5]MDY7115031.1 TIGR04282 family arsenosugar biosynthesis glycosyltransferase [Halomonas sp. SSL-5]
MCAEAVHAEVRLAILAKAPLPGRVKTRLIPACGAEEAARIHATLLRHTLAVACAALPPSRITLWTALEHEHPLFVELAARHGIARRPQPEGDLGERMYYTLAPGPAMVIGSDCPPLTPALLRRCAEELARHDAVCLPAEDGGYALLGLHQAHPSLFTGIAWGGERVMAQTRQRLAALGWRLACPATVWDLDRPEDLERWRSMNSVASR